MNEQQYRVIADRDKGDDPRWGQVESGDRVWFSGPLDDVDRIERPMTTTDEPTPGELIARERARQIAKGYTGEHDAQHGVPRLLEWASRFAENGEHIKAAAMVEAARAIPSPHPPTREQIAEVLFQVDYGPDASWARTPQVHHEFLVYADAVLALIQNGANRG